MKTSSFITDLQRYQAEHRDVGVLGADKGWNLHKAYQKHPDTRWFVFVDADTYLGWTNLL